MRHGAGPLGIRGRAPRNLWFSAEPHSSRLDQAALRRDGVAAFRALRLNVAFRAVLFLAVLISAELFVLAVFLLPVFLPVAGFFVGFASLPAVLGVVPGALKCCADLRLEPGCLLCQSSSCFRRLACFKLALGGSISIPPSDGNSLDCARASLGQARILANIDLIFFLPFNLLPLMERNIGRFTFRGEAS